MKVWTVIPLDEYKSFEKTGILQCDDKHPNVLANSAGEYSSCYRWMADQLRKQVNSSLKYPRWIWYQIEGNNSPLSVNKCFYRVDNGEFVLLVFDVPEKLVLLSDYIIWHICLNGGHLEYTEKESDAWDKLIDSYSDFLYKRKSQLNLNQIMNDEYFFSLSPVDRSYAEPIRQKIFDSWKIVFDITIVNDWIGSEDRTIQGVTWTLDKKDLIETHFFTLIEEDHKRYEDSLE